MSDTPYSSTSIQSGDKLAQVAVEKSYVAASEGAGAKRYLLVALAFLVLPVLAIFNQTYRSDNGTLIRLPVQIGELQPREFNNNYIPTKLFPTVGLNTHLNRISTKNLTGHNIFKAKEQVFVFLSPGPNDIWYPYAVSKRAPKSGCYVTSCLILSGRVVSTEQDVLNIRYQYEEYIPNPEMVVTFKGLQTANAELLLSVDRNGRTMVRALNVGGKQIDQRKLPIDALLGLTQRIASTAPTE